MCEERLCGFGEVDETAQVFWFRHCALVIQEELRSILFLEAENMCAVHKPKFGQYQNFGGAVTLSGVPRYIAPSGPYYSGHTPQMQMTVSIPLPRHHSDILISRSVQKFMRS